MTPPADDPVELATRSLRHRDRSRSEIDERLARAGVADAAREDALETLERLGYLDDGRFALGRAEALALRGYGDEAIRDELARRGVGADEAAEALAALEPERERARALVEQLGAGSRAARQLARKGFPPELVEELLGGE